MTRALGIIHMVVSGVMLLILIGVTLILLYGEGFDLSVAWVVIAVVVVSLGLLAPGFVGGLGLVYGKRWARGLIMVLSFVMLPAFPFGTLLGGFGLWVLFTDGPDPLLKTGEHPIGPRSNAPPTG